MWRVGVLFFVGLLKLISKMPHEGRRMQLGNDDHFRFCSVHFVLISDCATNDVDLLGG